MHVNFPDNLMRNTQVGQKTRDFLNFNLFRILFPKENVVNEKNTELLTREERGNDYLLGLTELSSADLA